MKISSLSSIFGLVLAGLAGGALFWTSQNVQTSERELRTIEAQLGGQHEEMRVLKAEWDYLNRPDRLEKLAREKLGLVAQPPEQRVHDPAKLIEETISETVGPTESAIPQAVTVTPTTAATPVALEGDAR